MLTERKVWMQRLDEMLDEIQWESAYAHDLDDECLDVRVLFGQLLTEIEKIGEQITARIDRAVNILLNEPEPTKELMKAIDILEGKI